MNFLFSFFPEMTLVDLIIHVVAIIGAILLTYAVFLEAERRQDLVFLLGSVCLFIYALWLGNKIFMIAMGGLIFASAFEFIEIMVGIHKHGPEMMEKYKYPKGKS